jgi:hypothetical protein
VVGPLLQALREVARLGQGVVSWRARAVLLLSPKFRGLVGPVRLVTTGRGGGAGVGGLAGMCRGVQPETGGE